MGEGAGAAYSFVAAEEFVSVVAVARTEEFLEESVKFPARKCRTLREVGVEREGTSGPIYIHPHQSFFSKQHFKRENVSKSLPCK